MAFDGDMTQVSEAARRWVAAGGTIVNLIVAGLAFLSWRRARSASGWFFLWLLTTISLLQATGYLLFSGLGNIGDWAVVVAGWPGSIVWHVVLAIIGAATYWWVTRWSMLQLGNRLGESESKRRTRAAYRFTLVAYVTGGLLYVIAGSLDPAGVEIVLISGVAASFGGTSGLAWGPQLLRNPRLSTHAEPALVVARDWRWIVIGAVCAMVYVGVFGPGICF